MKGRFYSLRKDLCSGLALAALGVAAAIPATARGAERTVLFEEFTATT